MKKKLLRKKLRYYPQNLIKITRISIIREKSQRREEEN